MSVFLFKQKTAYEVRISDWSSDVCSSDLRRTRCRRAAPATVSGQAAYAGPIPEDPLQRFSRCPACPSRRACGPRCDAERPIRACLRRSEEHTSELQSLMRISYAVFCLKKKKSHNISIQNNTNNQRAHTTKPL